VSAFPVMPQMPPAVVQNPIFTKNPIVFAKGFEGSTRQNTLESNRAKLKMLPYELKRNTKAGKNILELLSRVCPPKGYTLVSEHEMAFSMADGEFNGLAYDTGIPGVYVTVNFDTFAFMRGRVGVVSFSPNSYYSGYFPSINADNMNSLSNEEITEIYKTVNVEVKNCLEIAETIKKNPLCTCCGVPMRENIYYGSDDAETNRVGLGQLMKLHLADPVKYKSPHKSPRHKEWEDHPEFWDNGDIWGWNCQNCGRKFAPWERTDVPPEYNTFHPHYNCYCGAPVKYTLDSGGRLILRCEQCWKYLADEECMAIKLSQS